MKILILIIVIISFNLYAGGIKVVSLTTPPLIAKSKIFSIEDEIKKHAEDYEQLQVELSSLQETHELYNYFSKTGALFLKVDYINRTISFDLFAYKKMPEKETSGAKKIDPYLLSIIGFIFCLFGLTALFDGIASKKDKNKKNREKRKREKTIA